MYNTVAMNVFVAVMLIFAAAGFIDKALGGRFGLSESFDRGLGIIPTMLIPIVSVCSVGAEFFHRHIDQVTALSEHLFFDPSMIVGAILAPDLGGYFICREITDSPQMLVLSGVVLGTLLGQATTFQLPVFMASVDNKDHPGMFRGFIVGMIVVPAGLLIAWPMLRMPAGLFLKQFLPILIICMIIAAGLHWKPRGTARVFSTFGHIVNWLYYLMFAVAVLGVFIPRLAYASPKAVEEAVMISFKCAIVAAGALVMSELILKFFRRRIQTLAERIGINEVAAVSLLLTCATSLAILPLFPRMDERGKQIVTAFSMSGSYVFGGSMAFVSNVADGYTVLIFIVTKMACGFISAWVIHRMTGRPPATEAGGGEGSLRSRTGGSDCS